MEVSSPPGVSIWITTNSSEEVLALRISFATNSATTGLIAPSILTTIIPSDPNAFAGQTISSSAITSSFLKIIISV